MPVPLPSDPPSPPAPRPFARRRTCDAFPPDWLDGPTLERARGRAPRPASARLARGIVVLGWFAFVCVLLAAVADGLR